MMNGATLSEDRVYRYDLWRTWPRAGSRYAMFIGLNPSTADETQDDPTIRRCVAFARSWGYGGLCMMNLFAFRATKPEDMKAALNPIGPSNNRLLISTARDAGIVIASWGTHGAYLNRGAEVRLILPGVLHYLRLTKLGHPGHPLYLPSTLSPILWN